MPHWVESFREVNCNDNDVSNTVVMLYRRWMSAAMVDDPANWSVKARWGSGSLSQQFFQVSWIAPMWLTLTGSRSVSLALRSWLLVECSNYSIVLEQQTSSRTCSSRMPVVLRTHMPQPWGTMLRFDRFQLLYDAVCRGCWKFAIFICCLVGDWLSCWLLLWCMMVMGHLRYKHN